MTRSAELSFHLYDGLSPTFDTTCGKKLQFNCGLQKGVSVEFAVYRLKGNAPDYENSDALGLDLWVPDRSGRVWKAEARISSEYLHELLSIHATRMPTLPLFGDLDESHQAIFDRGCDVRDVRFFTDDRQYRHYVINDVRHPLQYKYRNIYFDIAFVDFAQWIGAPEDRWPGLPDSLIIKATFSHDDPDTELTERLGCRERYEALPAIIFEPPSEDFLYELLRGNDAFIADEGAWERGPFVNPLLFEST